MGTQIEHDPLGIKTSKIPEQVVRNGTKWRLAHAQNHYYMKLEITYSSLLLAPKSYAPCNIVNKNKIYTEPVVLLEAFI